MLKCKRKILTKKTNLSFKDELIANQNLVHYQLSSFIDFIEKNKNLFSATDLYPIQQALFNFNDLFHNLSLLIYKCA